jgi:dipeptidyl aminopeptidase/acylaminoacyl peptidase
MRKLYKIATGGVASIAAVTGILVGPMTITTHAASLENMTQSQKILKLKTTRNSDVDVSTELDCSTHTLSAKVTNKSTATIHPDVTFNNEAPTIPSTLPIEPGKTANYFYSYSNNNRLVNVDVKGDTFGDVKTSPTLYCLEPVSFTVTNQSSSAVVGDLRNNSTLVPQTVYTRVNNGDVRLETLTPGESRTIALPFNGVSGQTSAMVTIGTPAGYESSYSVDLNKIEVPLSVLPLPIGQ